LLNYGPFGWEFQDARCSDPSNYEPYFQSEDSVNFQSAVRSDPTGYNTGVGDSVSFLSKFQQQLSSFPSSMVEFEDVDAQFVQRVDSTFTNNSFAGALHAQGHYCCDDAVFSGKYEEGSGTVVREGVTLFVDTGIQ
jgi:hypothetical protein